MGGVRTTGTSVDCDRCKKTVAVTDEKQAEFYRAFAGRPPEKADERMFVAILNTPDGGSTEVDFEYVCPRCSDACFGYLAKIDTALAPEKPVKEPETPTVPATVPTPEPAPSPKPVKAAKGGKKVDVKVEPAKVPDAPPAPPDDDKPGVPYTDDDLFT